jgi:hypothetical protein
LQRVTISATQELSLAWAREGEAVASSVVARSLVGSVDVVGAADAVDSVDSVGPEVLVGSLFACDVMRYPSRLFIEAG